MNLRQIGAFLLLHCLSLFSFGQSIPQPQFSSLNVYNGLSNNQVNTMLKDNMGFMWFGTMSGLNRFDGHQFKVFRNNTTDTTSISDDYISNIYELPDNNLYVVNRNGVNIYNARKENFSKNVNGYLATLKIYAGLIKEVLKDNNGDFWFNAADQGLFKYEVKTGITRHLPCSGKGEASLSESPVSAIEIDAKGNVWVIHQNKTIELIDKKGTKVALTYTVFKTKELNDHRLFVDRDGDLWVYIFNTQHGIDYYQPAKNTHRYIDKSKGGLNSDLISGIIQDGNGLIWIATDHGGINLLNKADFGVSFLLNKEDNSKTLIQNSIISLYRDPTGIIWIGTFKRGISYYHEKIIKFSAYNHQNAKFNGPFYDDVNRFAEDKNGNLWIGTNGGGLMYFNTKTDQVKRYVHDPGNSSSISNNVIVGLLIDHQEQLWIGSYFGGLDCFDGHRFKNFRHEPSNPNSLADDRVWDILEDKDHNLWIATLGSGLDKFDRKTQTFKHYNTTQKNSIGSDYVSRLIQDREGNLWIGTANGLDKLVKNTNRFIHYKKETENPNSLINDNIYDLLEDSYGYIWAGTRDGLSRFDPRSGRFKNFGIEQGLTETVVMKILEDKQRNLWVSTANGLFHILVKNAGKEGLSYSFRNYDKEDGLQDNAFNAGSGQLLRNGRIIFGGANGFNLFKPGDIKSDTSIPEIIFSDLQVANKSVGIDEVIAGDILLKQSLAYTNDLTFNHHLNVFSIAFSAVNFFNPDKIRYQYRLIGFDKHWQDAQGEIGKATYTNLDAGDYVFKVRSTNAAGNWVDNEKSIQITVLPPFWRSTFAYVLYALFLGGTLFYIRYRGIRKIRNEFVLKQERQQAKRMHELDMLKIKFFTNVSHEFRTPLSLIITPLDKLIKQAKDQDKGQLQMIQRNGRRLLNLVNQLLDFRRMEVQELQLHRKNGDIVAFIKELSFSFSDEAEKKSIKYSFNTNRNSLITLFDHDKIERILFNLLSNAFKFTPQDGEISVEMFYHIEEDGMPVLRLQVCDTGIGISPGKEDKIFERFFQSATPDTIVNQGSGIGLSITKEFVKLHGGEITVKNRETAGCVFTIVLPLPDEMSITAYPEENNTDVLEADLEIILDLGKENAEKQVGHKKPILLLVEDNDDFRFYLKDNLKEYYQIAEAADGNTGWQKVLSVHPNLVVSDVSMPGLTGIELCKKMKSDKRTAAIPVILLTALTAEEKQLEGLDTGASDYMTKPFNFEILLSKIRNLLVQQKISKQTYKKQLELSPVETEIESVNEKFLRSASQLMEKHLADTGYSVDQFSSDLNMSRVGLYKKLTQITGQSPVEFMRSYRLKKAIPLLEKSQLTISEIAYEVGFNNPKQFSKYFKQEFDLLPSEYIYENAEQK